MPFLPDVTLRLFVTSFLLLQIYFDKHAEIVQGMNTIPNQYARSNYFGFGDNYRT
jgi:hypothetical protein